MIKDLIEEQKREFDRRTNSNNYEVGQHRKLIGEDMLLDPEWYPESPYEIGGEKVKDFLTQAMTLAYEAGGRGELKRCKRVVNKYFKHLVVIPYPQLTKTKLLKALTPDQLNNEREV